jgi:nicotinamidase-related amidase
MAATKVSQSITAAQTCLLIIDSQLGVSHPTYWGTARSNPAYEDNVVRLITAFRSTLGPSIIHIFHSSIKPGSALRPDNTYVYASAPGFRGVDINPIHVPQGDELVLEKSLNSAFVGPCGEELVKTLRERGV